MMYSLLSLRADWIFRPADSLRDEAWTSFKDTHTQTHIHLFGLRAQKYAHKSPAHIHVNAHREMSHAHAK